MLTNLVLLTGLAVVLIIIGAVYMSFRREDHAREVLAESIASGMNQPASLYPQIALDVCIGSGACVDACPESVLDRIDGLTQAVFASNCVGHGRCHASCPVGAIALVFGTAERGVDIPLLRAGYETNVDGVFIVGELGGMGLIRNAMKQGVQAIESIPKVLARPNVLETNDPDIVDTVIVGAGPAGIATALECVHKKVSYSLVEQYTMGGAITNFPRRKLVMTEEIKLPIVGKFGKPEMLKEELVAEFERVLLEADITVDELRRVTAIKGKAGDFRVTTEGTEGGTQVYRGRTIVLAIGRRGSPRQLGVPGEDLNHVVYKLIDPEQYRHRKVLCVGGGDSCLEAAVALSGMAGCKVTLSYRGKSFYRAKKKNRTDLDAAVAKGKITLLMESNVKEITPDSVSIERAEGRQTLEIDDVIINIGGILPTAFLESIGVEVETKHGEVFRAPDVGKHSQRMSGRFGSSRRSKAKP